jgi:hypothetical protein
MNSDDPPDERVIYRKRFQAVYFDFRGKSIFTRYDRCEFVKCTLLIDHSTEQLDDRFHETSLMKPKAWNWKYVGGFLV